MSSSPNHFSIVIPAHNEEQNLAACVRSIRESADYAGVEIEIIVVLNRCTDATESIARALELSIVRNDSKNLSQIRNTGVRHSSFEHILTIDADSRMSKNLLSVVRRRFGTGRYLAGGTLILVERVSLGILCTGICIWAYMLLRRISVGCFFFTRSLFDEVGGFDESRTSAEDIDFAVRLRRAARRHSAGYANVYSAYIRTSARKFDRFGDWYMLNRPREMWALLRGNDQKLADRYWYDVEREAQKRDAEQASDIHNK